MFRKLQNGYCSQIEHNLGVELKMCSAAMTAPEGSFFDKLDPNIRGTNLQRETFEFLFELDMVTFWYSSSL
jgi:hypothetical protein